MARVERRYLASVSPAAQVEVWVADLSQVPDDLQRHLDVAERARGQRIVDEQASRRWLASRAVLRELLAMATRADPVTIELRLGPRGKPYVDSASGEAVVRFNVSHSGTLALYAICPDREVGVDVELLTRSAERSMDEVAIARRMLGETVAARLQALAGQERRREFLRAWVAHEALVKCLGVGLGGEPARADRRERPDVWVTSLEVGETALAALAVQGGPAAVEQRVWTPDQRFAGSP
jgi:4'-phosphopantetheinyl transferase